MASVCAKVPLTFSCELRFTRGLPSDLVLYRNPKSLPVLAKGSLRKAGLMLTKYQTFTSKQSPQDTGRDS